jgi:hypothetical protein
VNPWNINDVAAAIEDALTMSEEERRERHRQNYMHVATHTAQVGAGRGGAGRGGAGRGGAGRGGAGRGGAFF